MTCNAEDDAPRDLSPDAAHRRRMRRLRRADVASERDALRREIERLADSFERQSYQDWNGEELAALMREVLAKGGPDA